MLIRVIYFAVVALLVVAVVEGGVRLFRLAPPLLAEYTAYAGDPWLPHKPRPLSRITGRNATNEFDYDYRHNDLGFRDENHQREKPPGVFRILGLGDSFTYGVGAAFEDTYLYQLEKRLNARPGAHPRVEIIKAGIPRFWPEPERLLLQHYGLQFSPDLIMVFFLANDVLDTFEGMHALRVAKDGMLRTGEAEKLGDAGTWLYIHSHAARIVLKYYISSKIKSSLRVPRPQDVYKAGGFHEQDWRKIETEYDQMIALTGRIGAKMVFVYIPQMSPGDEAAFYPAKRLSAWCRSRQAAFIDTMPALREAAKTKKVYYAKDGHCTPEGYRVIAETIFSTLVDKRMIP